MIFLIWVVVIIAALLLYYCQIYSTFSKRGVKSITPLPLIGNLGRLLLRLDNVADAIEELYNAFPEERFVGRYELVNNMRIIIRDLELIKKVTVKDFEYFLDHRNMVDEVNDPVFGRNLISLSGQEWKDMRSMLSPAFTSSKIRLMVPFMVDVGELMIKSLKKKIEYSGVDYLDVECKDLTTRYANDVIASCAFGLKVDSQNDTDNEFYRMGKTATSFTFRQILMILLFITFPKISGIFKFTIFSRETKTFFSNLVLDTMKDRETRKIIRHDMIHLLMEAKKGQLSHDENAIQEADAGFATVEESTVGKKVINRAWTDNDLIAQAVLFFLGGFATVSSTMSFLLHELALHPEVQERLVQEIRNSDAKTGGKFDYNTIQNLPYLDMVVSETLRLWPPAIVLDRICIKNYNLGKPNSEAKDFIVPKGMSVGIPVWAIHRDPQYFPDPLKFDPERFSEENKHNIQPFTYMPFGLGPRNCIGSRFALCEVKIMAYELLQHIELFPCNKTCIPTELSRDSFSVKIKGGYWLRFRIRK